jgi:hypothetical protein
MTKRLLRLWGLLLICGLVACQSAASPTLAPSATPQPTAAKATATPEPVLPTATSVSEVNKEEEPKPTATQETAPAAQTEPPWQIPRVQESDWTHGADDAGLVVVEYSDFQ